MSTHQPPLPDNAAGQTTDDNNIKSSVIQQNPSHQEAADDTKQRLPWESVLPSSKDCIDLGVLHIDKRQLGTLCLRLVDKAATLGVFLLAVRVAIPFVNTAAEGILRSLGPSKKANNATAAFLKPNSTLNDAEKEILTNMVLPIDIKEDWNVLGGLQSVKQELWETVQFEMKNSSLLAAAGPLQRSAKSVLIHGPPGCGKTAIIRGLSKKLGWPLLSIRPSSVMRMYVGESEMLVRALFELAKKSEPVVVFVDEIESLLTSREKSHIPGYRQIQNEFFQAWDDVCRTSSKILLVGVTNRPQDLDPALQRRFDKVLVIQRPDYDTRLSIFKKALRAMKTEKDFDYKACARATEGYLSSDIINLCLKSFTDVAKEHVRLLKAKKQQAGAAQTANDSSSSSGTGFVPQRAMRTADVLEAIKQNHPLSMSNHNSRSPNKVFPTTPSSSNVDGSSSGFWGRSWDEFPADSSQEEEDSGYEDDAEDDEGDSSGDDHR